MISESEPIGIRSSLYRPLSTEGVEQIAEAAFDVLARGGVMVHSEEAIDAFESAGEVVDRSTRNVKEVEVKCAYETAMSSLLQRFPEIVR